MHLIAVVNNIKMHDMSIFINILVASQVTSNDQQNAYQILKSFNGNI